MKEGLASARLASDLTQADLAARWGRSQSQVARVENAPIGSATVKTLCLYAQALGGRCRIYIEVDGEHFELVGPGSSAPGAQA